jgi:hypothetical protein
VGEAGARPPAGLRVGPDFFRFSVDEEFDALFGEQGMEDRAVRTVAFAHRVATADELWDGFLGGTIRTSALIVRQPKETQRRIREARSIGSWATTVGATASSFRCPRSSPAAANQAERRGLTC